ncbi:alpha/beta fold hydrolase [Jeotgalibacillus salarius]|uniref:Alpha/beta hydrolase n=1 Tax=Jeotgalibacillus salarius TaxID=546023 RepID=A0A4Y8LIY9_9BACL|nr:alpha/beta hydrolase [Jeotgalibacillus salarius]TFE02898.1 alpha/beta hydrolase [Jeotgalibacillus salarius]
MAESYKGFKSKEGFEQYYTTYKEVMNLWKISYEEKIVQTSFGDVSVKVCGNKSKEPLVFFHAFGFSSAEWYECATKLSADFELYFIDVLGEFNLSNTKEHLNEREDYATWITEVFDEFHFTKVTITGHSNGGWHAMNYAILKPERVKSLIILSPAASIKRMNLSFYFRLLLTNLIPNKSIIINHFCRWLTVNKKPEHEKLHQLYFYGQKHVTWEYVMTPPKMFKDEELSTLTMPVYVAAGRQEVIYNPLKMLDKADKKIKSSSTHLFDKGGHMLPVEIPDELADYIKSVLLDHT